MDNSNAGKIAIITGTSSGIGLQTAVLLAQAGFTVVATMRDIAKAGPLQELASQTGVKLSVRQLDVQDQASIDGCLESIIKDFGRVDLLVNNAGAGYLGSLEQTTLSDLRRTMEVNFFGVWAVTQAVFPLMRAAGSGRIVTVTSVGGLIGQPFNDAYCAAKFAVEGFMESLAPVAKQLGIKLALIEPGPVNTEFVGTVQATRTELEPTQQAVYGSMINAYIGASVQNFSTMGQTPAEVGQIVVEAATTANPHFRYTISEMIKGLVSRKYVDPTGDNIIEFFASRLK